MKLLVFSILLVVALTACGGSGISVAFGAPTSTPTDTPTPLPTATPNLEATATVQAQATGTARAVAVATSDAQSTATAAALATTRAQSTATAAAQATATRQAFVDGINTIAASAKKFYGPAEGKLEGQDTSTDTLGYVKNFVLDVKFFNPADRAVHPWDFGLIFRYVDKLHRYRLILDSDGRWVVTKPEKSLADAIQVTSVGSGVVPSMDLTPTGSNQLRLIVRDNAAFIFVNGQFVSTVDVSAINSSGDMAISTAAFRNSNFPGLSVRYQNLTVSSLP